MMHMIPRGPTHEVHHPLVYNTHKTRLHALPKKYREYPSNEYTDINMVSESFLANGNMRISVRFGELTECFYKKFRSGNFSERILMCREGRYNFKISV